MTKKTENLELSELTDGEDSKNKSEKSYGKSAKLHIGGNSKSHKSCELTDGEDSKNKSEKSYGKSAELHIGGKSKSHKSCGTGYSKDKKRKQRGAIPWPDDPEKYPNGPPAQRRRRYPKDDC